MCSVGFGVVVVVNVFFGLVIVGLNDNMFYVEEGVVFVGYDMVVYFIEGEVIEGNV